MTSKMMLLGVLATLALIASGAGSASAGSKAGARSKTAPASCKVFNPLFEWKDGQERSIDASANQCDAAPGRRA